MFAKKLPCRGSFTGSARSLALATGLLLWTGCGSFGPSAGSSAEEVTELKRRIVELQQRATVSEVEVQRLRREIADLERELAEARRTSASVELPRPPSGIVEDVETVPIDPAGGVEETDLEEPPPWESPLGDSSADELSPAPSATDPVPGRVPAAAAPDQATALYDQGYTLFHQERYADARERFRRFLELYPDTDLADNAQFWIGETHYAREDFAAALQAFMATIERYPEGNKVPDALLKAGKCLEALGRTDQARQTYHEVTDRFPDSAAAAVARERLTLLR